MIVGRVIAEMSQRSLKICTAGTVHLLCYTARVSIWGLACRSRQCRDQTIVEDLNTT